jgi:predicted kinase
VHLRSDVERKRLAGIGALERTDSPLGQGIYARTFTARVYAYLAESAQDVLSGGYSVIIDGTFSRCEDRNLFRELARRMGVPACLVRCCASQEVLRRRIAERARYGHDASEADLAVLEWQEENFESIAAGEQWPVISVETAEVDPASLGRRIAALGV